MRIPLAFYPDVICEGTVDLCAEESAKDEGDARRAIFLLQAGRQFCHKDRMFKGLARACNNGLSKGERGYQPAVCLEHDIP